MPSPTSPATKTFLELLADIDARLFRHWNGVPMMESTIGKIYGPETIEIARRVRAALSLVDGTDA